MAFIIQLTRLRKQVLQQLQEVDVMEEKDETSPTPIDDHQTTDADAAKMSQPPSKPCNLSRYSQINGITLEEDCNGEQYFRVGWAGQDDPFNPRNWHTAQRLFATLSVCLIALIATMASSIDAAIITKASNEFGVSDAVESLATGMYLIGFGIGALIASPLSEMVGRYPVYLGALSIFAAWLLGAALAPNIGAQIVFRFLAGLSSSAPLTVAGGSVSDVWDTLEKTFAFPFFAIQGFGGPCLGPIVGAYIGQSPHISWRWTEWIMLILDGLLIVLILLFKHETFGPQLLYYKARFFRQATGDPRFKTEIEASGVASVATTLRRHFSRPWILAIEPIVIFMTFYLTVVYIVLFTFLDGYPFIFGRVHHINDGLSNICFIGLWIGILLSMVLVPILYKRTARQLKNEGDDGSGRMLQRESRLFFAMVGAPALPIGLFWMSWTDFSSISIWSPLIASAAIGFANICIFMSAYMYVIDSYLHYAASALTFVALVRYLAAGGMTVVGIPMYKNLGVHWALTVLGVISVIATPIPYVLYIWGPNLRKRSKWATAIST